MITSRDINSTKEMETKHLLIDVIERWREYYNRDWHVHSVCELEIPYPEEFIRSPNRKFVRVISTKFVIRKPQEEMVWNESAGRYESLGNLESPFREIETHFTLKVFPEDTDENNDFTSIGTKIVPKEMAIAASFVQDTTNDHQIICLCNESVNNYIRTYEQHTTQRSFHIWIYDMLERVKMNLGFLCDQYTAILLELELVY